MLELGCYPRASIFIFIFLISKLKNIFTKKGQALEYTGSIQKKEKQKRDE